VLCAATGSGPGLGAGLGGAGLGVGLIAGLADALLNGGEPTDKTPVLPVSEGLRDVR